MVAKGYKFGGNLPDGVDARLDNREGLQRPPLETDPAVPQQVDGPDVEHQAEHSAAVEKLNLAKDAGERRGSRSPGDHSLGEDEAAKGNDAGQADKVLETDPGNPSSAPTSAKANKEAAAGSSTSGGAARG